MNEAIEGEYEPYEDDEVEELGDSQQLLNYSQRIRKTLVNEMTKAGMPQDKDERGTLLQTLRDMDTTSIHRLKLDVDQQQVDNDRQAQAIVQQLYDQKPRGLAAEPGYERDEIPAPSHDELPEIETVEGETEVGLNQEDSKSFLKRMDSEQ